MMETRNFTSELSVTDGVMEVICENEDDVLALQRWWSEYTRRPYAEIPNLDIRVARRTPDPLTRYE